MKLKIKKLKYLYYSKDFSYSGKYEEIKNNIIFKVKKTCLLRKIVSKTHVCFKEPTSQTRVKHSGIIKTFKIITLKRKMFEVCITKEFSFRFEKLCYDERQSDNDGHHHNHQEQAAGDYQEELRKSG